MKSFPKLIKNTTALEKLLWLYIILIPFMRVPKIPLLGQKMQYSDIIFLPLFIIGVGVIWRRGKLKLLPLEKTLLGTLCVFLLSVFFSKSGLASFVEFSGMVYLLSMYFVISRIIDTEQKWMRVVKLWTVVAIGLSAAGLLGYLWALVSGAPNFLLEHYINARNVPLLAYRAKASFRLAIMFASYLHASLVVIMIWIAKRGQENKSCLLLWFGVIVCLAAAVLTHSRINAGIALTLVCVLSITKGKKMLSLFRYVSFLSFVCYFILALSTTIWWIFPIKIESPKNSKTVIVTITKTKSIYYQLNVAAVKMVKQHPFFGVGMGNFKRSSVNYINWEKAKSSYQDLPEEVSENIYKKGSLDPHSTFLGWASETGLLGLLAIGVVFWLFLRGFLFEFSYGANAFWKYGAGVFFFSVIGFLLNGLYIDILTMRHFWLLMALGVSAKKVFASCKE